MATSLTTIKNWFKTGLKPTQAQFWAVFDSFRHKDDGVPAGDVSGLQELLDGKMDKKAITATIKAGTYVPGQAYVYDALIPEYVSFSNPNSESPDFQAEGWYRLTANATGVQTPETNPEIWKYNGRTLGDVTMDDVFGLREALDDLKENTGTGGGHLVQDNAGTALAQQAVLQFKGVSVTNDVTNGKTIVDVSGKANNYSNPVLPVAAGACAVDFDSDKVFQQFAISGTFQFQKGASNLAGKMAEICLTADGVTGHKPTFSTDFFIYSDNWTNVNGAKNLIRMKYIQDGHQVLTQIIPVT